MTQKTSFGARSTADRVLAGIDLSGKNILVTGSGSSIGFETASALAANGAHVIVAARTLHEAASACSLIGYQCSPLECDLGDLKSVAAAAAAVRLRQAPLDAIVANAGTVEIGAARVRYGVEQHFLVNHLGHFALLNDLAGVLRDATGRIVIVTRPAAGAHAVADGIMYAKELSRRLGPRGITVNAANPGRVRDAGLNAHRGLAQRLVQFAVRPFRRSPAQGAATVALLAASPNVAGITGEYWQDCAIGRSHDLSNDGSMAARLWETCESIIAGDRASRSSGLAVAA